MPEISASETNASASAAISGRRRGRRGGTATTTGASGIVLKPGYHMACPKPMRKVPRRSPSSHSVVAGRCRGRARSGGGADAGLPDLAVDVALKLLEVGLEASDHVARGAVVGLLVLPGILGIQHLSRHVRTGAGHLHAEVRVGRAGDRSQAAVERGAHHGAGMTDRHALADTGPAA